jgi:glycosyltransferase involved in cell wall biosynthesis
MSTAIIIPSFNSASWLEETIQSALRQTRPAAEIVVVDDGSTDGTAAVCTPYLKSIRYIPQANAGVSAARNHGAAVTQSDWLLFLDADDQLLPHANEALLQAGSQAVCGVAFGRVIMRGATPEKARLHGDPRAAGPAPTAALANWKRAVISTPGAAIVRRTTHEAVGGFQPGLEPIEDGDYWVKAGVLTTFALCDTVVLDKRFVPGSAHTQTARRVLATMRAQLGFLEWARTRGITTDFLKTSSARIADTAVRDANYHRCWDILPAVLAKADELGARGFWVRRARARLAVRRLLGRA